MSKSVILSQRQSFELLNLCQFSSDIEWTLLYRASQDGFEAKHFHSKCDSHCRTLTIFKSAEPHTFIFGGYTDCTWGATRKSAETKDPNAFVFSLTNRDGKPCRIRVSKEWSSMSIDCHAACGPSFGIGDIFIYVTKQMRMEIVIRTWAMLTSIHAMRIRVKRRVSFWPVRINFN